ncbi:MAG: hypothetical protein CSA81_00075 [Acidobacteria bacterium]|nr:MAG: hypothetical protein CSA81_00075 [Acidobacteriota bacterium]PIE91594.1 MAG: hypothetical protein CR997_00125 [Acidobacteriota bacterium]
MILSQSQVQNKLKEVPLMVVGIDFRLASSSLREKLIMTAGQREQLYRDLKKIDSGVEFMALETCNRVEWLAATDEPRWMGEILKARILKMWKDKKVPKSKRPEPFVFEGEDAIRHIFDVVVGKESLAMGEAQIAGQFHHSCREADREKTTGPILKKVAASAGRLAKAGHRTGFRSNQKMGIHGLVTQFFKLKKKDAANYQIMVLGMGSIGRKTADLLEEDESIRVLRFNRTIHPKQKGKWIPLQEFQNHLSQSDAIVMATASGVPVLNTETLPKALTAKKMTILDIGIPLQVDKALQKASWVDYNNIDQLMDLPGRQEKEPIGLAELNAEIQMEMTAFTRFCVERKREMTSIISKLHERRQQMIHHRIPEMVEAHLVNLDKQQKKQVQHFMKSIINDYARDIHGTLIEAIDAYGGVNYD